MIMIAVATIAEERSGSDGSNDYGYSGGGYAHADDEYGGSTLPHH